MVTHALSDFKVKTAKAFISYQQWMVASYRNCFISRNNVIYYFFEVIWHYWYYAQTVRQWLEKALGKHEREAILLVFLQKLTKCQSGGWKSIITLGLGWWTLFSMVGLPIALSVGIDGFQQLLPMLLMSISKIQVLSRIYLGIIRSLE